MDEIVERVENNFISIYYKFDILDKKLNNYHIEIDELNKTIDIIISDEHTKIHNTYYPMKNYDLIQDRFFIHNAVIDNPLKKNSYIIFEYIFNSEYINIPLIINLKIDNVLQKGFNINLKEYNKIRHMFKLEYNITKINFYLYLYNNEIYNDEKMECLKKMLFNNKKIKFNICFFKYMNYYRKPIEKTVNDIKSKMQMGALTLKLSEHINKINDLIEVDKNIKKDIDDNSNLINSNVENISKSDNESYKKGLLITSNNTSIYGNKKRLDVIEKDIKNIPLNSTEIINTKNNLSNVENTIKNHNTDIIKIPNIENDINTINSNIKDISNIKTSLNKLKYRQDGINIILDKLTPLQDIVKNNTTNITNKHNISQINKKKSEFNTSLIDNNTENLKSIKNYIANYYKLKDIIIFDIQKTNISEDININSPKFIIIQSNLNNDFRKDSYLV